MSSTLVPVTDGVWRVAFSFRVIPGFYLPAHMTILRLADETLLLHSPIAVEGEAKAALDALGTVSAIVAPNLLHHKWLGWAAQAYPDATVYAPAGLAKKLPDAPTFSPLEDLGDGGLSGVRTLAIAGIPGLAETVFLHEASGSLVVADLVFNITEKRGFLSAPLLAMAGTSKGIASSKLVRRMVKDPAATRASLDTVVSWGFTRLVPAHGDVVTDAATEQFATATRRLAP